VIKGRHERRNERVRTNRRCFFVVDTAAAVLPVNPIESIVVFVLVLVFVFVKVGCFGKHRIHPYWAIV
jgi:hypothetical protein